MRFGQGAWSSYISLGQIAQRLICTSRTTEADAVDNRAPHSPPSRGQHIQLCGNTKATRSSTGAAEPQTREPWR